MNPRPFPRTDNEAVVLVLTTGARIVHFTARFCERVYIGSCGRSPSIFSLAVEGKNTFFTGLRCKVLMFSWAVPTCNLQGIFTAVCSPKISAA
jgi:hypothetical protein